MSSYLSLSLRRYLKGYLRVEYRGIEGLKMPRILQAQVVADAAQRRLPPSAGRPHGAGPRGCRELPPWPSDTTPILWAAAEESFEFPKCGLPNNMVSGLW